ncbi:MAG: DUF4199 domain-containing protein [Saprospiraceae bacterium]|nr:DUF4199 domain-containing protein [Saprospiraceae bacterium]
MNISKEGIKWGLIAGVVTVVIYIGAYMMGYKAFFNAGIFWATTIFYFFAMYMASREARNKFMATHDLTEEPYPFNIALQPPFLTFLIANILYYFFNYIMFAFVNPELPDIQRTILLENMDNVANSMSAFLKEDQIEEMVEAIEENDYKVTLGSTLLGLARSLLGGFLLSAIFALIFKKNQIQRLS